MKLLVLTQKVDNNDGVFGFFHNWIEKMAAKFETVEVICLELGDYSLPSNVKVRSLGKEKIKSKIKFIFRFYKFIWQSRKKYDTVFIHMNKEYAVLGGGLWRLLGKRVILWYNHEKGGFFARIGYFFVNRLFYTSPYSFFAGFKKAQAMPAGIDTDRFIKLPEVVKEKGLLLFLGRIAPIKNVDILIKAGNLCAQSDKKFIIDIIGDAEKNNFFYFESIKNLSATLSRVGRVKFFVGVSNNQTPVIYNQHEIFINLTNSGSLDKTILEAMACETTVLVSNESFKGILPEFCLFKERDINDLADKVLKLLDFSDLQKNKLGSQMRQFVVEKHNLNRLIEGIFYESSIGQTKI